MQIPAELLYSSDHEWVARQGNTIRMGITDYAQDALGDVVFVQVPSVGTNVAKGDSFSEVESTKSVSDIYAPVSGVVSAVNDALAGSPELVNSDPYGQGWICEITLTNESEIQELLDAAGYASLTGA